MSYDIPVMGKVKRGTFWFAVAAIVVVILVVGPMAGLWSYPFAQVQEETPAGPGAPPEDRKPDGKYLVSSTVKLHVVDLLNEKANVADEASGLKFYELYYGEVGYPNGAFTNPTNSILRDTVALTSGWATTTYEFWSGNNIFVRTSAIGTTNSSSDMAYFDYGEVYMVPWADSKDATNISIGDLELIKSSDWLNNASVDCTDIMGQYPVGTDSWDNNPTAEIDVATLDEITIGVRVYQDDDDAAYADWRPWTDWGAYSDYGDDEQEQRKQKAAFIVFDLELSGTSNAITTSVDDYLFVLESGALAGDTSGTSITYFGWGTGIQIFIPITNMDMAGARDVDAGGFVIGNHDGYKIITSLLLDVSDSVLDNTDEVDIELTLVSGYSLMVANQKHNLDYGTGGTDYYEMGEMFSAWITDWSIG